MVEPNSEEPMARHQTTILLRWFPTVLNCLTGRSGFLGPEGRVPGEIRHIPERYNLLRSPFVALRFSICFLRFFICLRALFVSFTFVFLGRVG
jgi:hypothetical protein